MQLRYSFRLYPTPVQRVALGRAFGCARVVFNDALTVRRNAYKAKLHGRYFGRIGRYEPASQACGVCGVKDGPKPLSVRVWTCSHCLTVLDRDVNASENVLAAGRADRVNACGGLVRPGVIPARPGEPGSHRDDRARQPARSVVGIHGP